MQRGSDSLPNISQSSPFLGADPVPGIGDSKRTECSQIVHVGRWSDTQKWSIDIQEGRSWVSSEGYASKTWGLGAGGLHTQVQRPKSGPEHCRTFLSHLYKNLKSRRPPVCARITRKVVTNEPSEGPVICLYHNVTHLKMLRRPHWETTQKLVHLTIFLGRESHNSSLWDTTSPGKLFCILDQMLIYKIKHSLSLIDMKSDRIN